VRFYVLPYMAGSEPARLMARMPSLEVAQTLTAGVDDVRPQVPDGVTLCNARGVHDASTAELALAKAGLATSVMRDERLRERELGLFDGLTGTGIRAEYADEARRREHLGKFYYRPPGGESWCDVALRVRSFLSDVGTRPATDRLWIFTHQAVITCFRYVLEGMDETAVLELDRTVDVPNASTTTYRRGPAGVPELVEYASSAVVQARGATPTKEPEHAGRGSAS